MATIRKQGRDAGARKNATGTSGSTRCVLTIAGSDSGGGAGVQADARTIHALGGFACMAITAITAQNPRGVQSWRPEPPELIAAQIRAVLGTSRRRNLGALPVRAIKTGLLPGAAAVQAIAAAVASGPRVPLVIDPVIGSTSGSRFLDEAGVSALCEQLLPLATLVTPNWPEAEALVGMRVKTFADAQQAASALVLDYGCAVLVKGGHAPGHVCQDCLMLRDGRVFWWKTARVPTRNTHGTGCVLSAAIATALAKGEPVERAVRIGQTFLQRQLRRHAGATWDGAGPAFPGG